MKNKISINTLRAAALCLALTGIALLAACALSSMETTQKPPDNQDLQQKYAKIQEKVEISSDKKETIEPCVTEPAAPQEIEIVDESGPLKAGQNLRPFVLTSLKGKPLDIAQNLSGSRLTLLVFADHLCPYSEEAIDRLSTISKQYSKEDLGISVVHVGEADQAARDFYANFAPDYPIGIDADEKIANQYGIQAVPTAFLVKPDSEIWYTELYNPRIEYNIALFLDEGAQATPASPPRAGSTYG